MTHVITQPCIGVKDKSCIDVCPMNSIQSSDPEEMLYIAPKNVSTALAVCRYARRMRFFLVPKCRNGDTLYR